MKITALIKALLYETLTTAFTIPRMPVDGPCTAQYDLSTTGEYPTFVELDSPKLSCINDRSFDWWGWDVISSQNYNVCLTIGTLAQLPVKVPGMYGEETSRESMTVLTNFIWITTAEGHHQHFYASGTGATIDRTERGLIGEWAGSGFSWEIDDVLDIHTVRVDSKELDIRGELRIESSTPPNLPCLSPFNRNFSTKVNPDFAWVSPIPYGRATVNMFIQGERLWYQGFGYHDRMWAESKIPTFTRSWNTGRARLGAYTVVWAKYITPEGHESSHAYIARNGQVLTSGCGPGILTVKNIATGETLEGMEVTIPIPDGEFRLTARTRAILVSVGKTTRTTGSFVAEVYGERVEGVGIFEEYVPVDEGTGEVRGTPGGNARYHDEL
ncbi:hypothetical protein BJY04DRAFT_223566 [Aspergillus karnatakaensis]|uniref:uncharacterized protein n=1 Tax=Aspergillus karnatakaensis TaxID=1810916 RepID=UPI003CCE2860